MSGPYSNSKPGKGTIVLHITIRPVGAIGPHNIVSDQLLIGDEGGVQGRFAQNIGHAMTAGFGSQGLDISFGDSRAVTGIYGHTPDVVLTNGQ